MKRLLTLLIFAISLQNYAQLPDAFNYQATVRAESGDLLVNTNVNFKVTIFEGQGVGDSYVESHFVPTDDLGHVNFVVGYGQPLEGSMSEIDWSMGNYFMKVELDTGQGFIDMGDKQLLSVPYALYAMDSGGEAADLQSVLDAGPNANLILTENNNNGIELTFNVQDQTDQIYNGFNSTVISSVGETYAIRGESFGESQNRHHGVEGRASGGAALNVGVHGMTGGDVGQNVAVWGEARNSQVRNTALMGYATFPSSGSNYGVSAHAGGSESLNVAVSAVVENHGSDNNIQNGESFGIFSSSTVPSNSTNYGIYSVAYGGSSNFAGYFSGDVYVDQSGYLKAENAPVSDNDVVNKGYLMEILASYQSQIDNLQAQIGTTNIGVIPSNIPLDGLYAYYPFNGNADDVIGDNFGTVVNNASLTSDRFGVDNKAYYFDGSNDYISLYEPWFDGNPSVSAFTYSLWVFVDQYPDEQSSINTKEGYWRTIGLELGTSGHIVFGGSQPSPNAYHVWVTPSGVIDVGQWNHIAVTFANSNLRIYINGQLSVNETASISDWDFSWFDSGNSTNTNLIGAVAPASGVTKFFNGKIDDFAIWSRALTENEVDELYDF